MSVAIRAKSALILLAAAGALLSGASPPAPLAGTYQADCAPYDGAAFRITLPMARGRDLELTANADLAQMAGRWVHDGGNARPGSATILDCRTVPERMCSYPQTGTFTVTGQSGGGISGTFDARFDDGTRLAGTFRAQPARNQTRLLCG